MENYKYLSEFLEKNGIRPSSQRVLMLKYIEENHNHPTADKIYVDLTKRLPSISKATVYNNLKLFLNSGIIKEVNIDSSEVHYEMKEDNHAHFVCNICKKVHDLEISNLDINLDPISDYEIDSQDIFLRGVCKECLDSKKN